MTDVVVKAVRTVYTNERSKMRRDRLLREVAKDAAQVNSEKHDIVACVAGFKAAAKVFGDLSSEISGRDAFKEAHKEDIQRMVKEEGGESEPGGFNKILKREWDATQNKEEWEEMARSQLDIHKYVSLTVFIRVPYRYTHRNQEEFERNVVRLFNGLCRSGKLGDVEIMLWCAFRNSTGGSDALR